MEDTNFISCIEDFEQDKVMVWERPISGGPRTLKFFDPPRYFYVPDEEGEHQTITNVPVKKVSADSSVQFKNLVRSYGDTFEADIRPDSRILMNHYFGRPTPIVNYAFFDIEVDVNSRSGWANPQNPYAPVNALTIWQSWTNTYKCYAVPPKNWDPAERESFESDVLEFSKQHNLKFVPTFVLCGSEEELLSNFIRDIQDCDILSGWNSELFDIPYIVERLKKVYGKDIGPRKLCFPGAGAPRMRLVEVFGNEEVAYELKGRTHIDYMDAFKKFTFEGRTSFSLANIAADELDVEKIDTGLSFEEMYNKHFFKFCVYNARDVEILHLLDKKFKFIQLINQMAHENTVPYSAIMGTVRYVDMGITNRVHKIHNRITINKPIIDDVDHGKVEGAVVFDPLFGLWSWIGSVDINSLYPSVIRALNMSYETFIGQFHNDVLDWRGIMDNRVKKFPTCPNGSKNVRYRSPEEIQFDFTEREYSMLHVSGDVITKTAEQWRIWFRENNYAISAFGTVFDQTQVGVVAETLTFWFSERKRLQAEKKRWGKVVGKLMAETGSTTMDDEHTHEASYKTEAGKVTKFYSNTEWAEIQNAKQQEEHFDLLQLTKKIQLNSTYGALLNKAFRYNRRELGASTTGTGREITIYMAELIGETLSGEHTEVMKYQLPGDKGKIENHYVCNNELIIYGDTDSNYFRIPVDNEADAVEIADLMAETVNAAFPEFMSRFFFCDSERSKLISAAREVVAVRGLFLNAKKKYTLRVVDKEGKKTDELKYMGSELKKADTPKIIQKFLKGLMDLVLTDEEMLDEEFTSILENYVNSNRKGLIHKTDDVIAFGVAKQINNLEKYQSEWAATEAIGKGKAKMPGHVRAAVNYNFLLREFGDTIGKALRSGDKGMIFYVKPNDYGIKALAFPADTTRLPAWFDEHFKVDLPLTEEKMIDMKLEGIFEALRKPIPTPKLAHIRKTFAF